MSESVNITLAPYSIPNKATKILRLKGKLHTKVNNNENYPNRQIENHHKMKISHKNKNFFPLSELSNHSNNSNSDNSKKVNNNEFIKIQPPKNVQTSAVARRNARERNRVKQVNNGFAILRQHIPEEVAEAYEAVGGRGASKKLSKVETLRMAVEYIRSLEKLLDLDLDQSENYSLNSFKSESHDDGEDRDELDDELDLIENNNIENCDSFSTTNTTTPTTVVDGTPLGDEYYIQYQNITFINDRQYICIPNEHQNTVQFIKLESNDENLPPHIIVGGDDLVPQTDIVAGPNISYLHENNLYHDDPAAAVTTTTTSTSKQYILDATMNYNNLISPLHIITPASISPNSYSSQSNSPVANNELITSTGTTTIPLSHTSTMLSAEEPTNIITTAATTTSATISDRHYNVDDDDDVSSNEYYDKIYTMTSVDDYSRHHSDRLLMQALPPIGSIKKELDYH